MYIISCALKYICKLSIFCTEQVKDLEVKKESLIKDNENLHKIIKELNASLKNSDTAFCNMKKNLEETKELNSRYQEEITILEDKVLKFSEQCSTTEKITNSKELKEVRIFSFDIFYFLDILIIIISVIIFLRMIIRTRKSNK